MSLDEHVGADAELVTVDSVRAVSRQRGGRAVARFLQAFSRQRAGVAGVVLLAFFMAIAFWRRCCSRPDMLDVTRTVSNPANAPPSAEFWLGTDENGRSILAVLAWGARISLTVGIAASIITMMIGTLVGIGSGHFGGGSAHCSSG